MAKKPGARRSRRHLAAAPSPGVQLAGLRGAFLAWLVGQGLPPDVDRNAVWRDVVATVDLAVARAGLADLSSWTTDQVATVIAAAEDTEAAIVPALSLVLPFLGDTGHWSGAPEELDTVLEMLEDASSPVAAILEELADVAVDPARERSALRALPVLNQVEALLRFLQPRRPITSTGALRRADVVAAADLLGLELTTRRPRSMWDVPRLAALWQAAQDAGLLVVAPTEATLTPLGHGWLSGDADREAEARARLVPAYLTAVLTEQPAQPWLPPPLTMMLPVLAAAALGRPVPTERLADPVAALDGAAGVPSSVAMLAGLASVPAHAMAHQLAGDGILDLGDTVAAAPGLHGVLARIAAALLSEMAAVDESGSELPAPDPALEGQAYRLRVELVDAAPPVWREVLVDPNLPLDELHEVIQQLFEWEDYHLHEFIAVGPGRRTTRYVPQGLGDDWAVPGDGAADEEAVRLGALIGPRRGSLRYVYDFGDHWEHRITVVGSEPADATALPRCVAGAGAAPAEDSGGVWGWVGLVEAAADPRHPEHRDARDVLGLADGGTPDPDHFDVAAVEERLAELRPPAVPPR